MKLIPAIRRSRLPQSILAAALAVAALVACQSLPPLYQSEPSDAGEAGSYAGTPAAPTMPTGAPTVAPNMPAGAPTAAPAWASMAYPGVANAYPSGTPVEPAAALHDEIAALPAGAKPDIVAAWLLDARWPALVQHAVPIRLADGRLDLAVVMSDGAASAASWILRRDGGLSIDPIRVDTQMIDVAPIGVINGAVVEAADGRRGLLVWNGLFPSQDSPVMLRAWLPLAGVDFISQDTPVGLVFNDWSGDGAMDALLEAEDSRAAVLYAATDEPHVLRSVARIVPPTQVVDVDADGVYELVRREGDLWRIERWGGEAFAAAEPITAALPIATPVTDGRLPPLPAELLFLRGEEIWRWPWSESGGSLQRVMADPGVGRTDGWQGGKPRLTNFRVAREGGQVVYPLGRFEKQGPEGFDVEITELFVFDPATGETTKVAPDIADQAAPNPDASFYDIGAGGDFVVYVGPDRTPDRCLSTISIAQVAEPRQAHAISSCGQRVRGSDERCGCDGLLLSPDGRRVAFSDSSGLWVADLPDGESRQLAENKRQGTMVEVPQPRLWSPDGRRLVSRLGSFEGSGNLLWDVDSGESRDLEMLEYHAKRWDLGWISDSSALIGATGTESLPARLSLSPADFREESHSIPLNQSLWPQVRHQLGTAAIAAQGLYSIGDVGFALRQGDPGAYPGNGVFRVGVDGKGLRALVGLPDAVTYQRHLDYEWLGDVIWSPLGQAFLFMENSPAAQGPVPTILGLSDGSAAWDVREVLGGGDVGGFLWGREGAN